MSSKIRILNEQAINQIAAGEVVENPASVVKELMENALDAGAGSVEVRFKAGGHELIEVSDDGCGMSRDDALLGLERHATSKIRASSDLESVRSLGFRGEALPSIASISRLSIATAEEGREGTLVVVEGGKVRSCRPTARGLGTTVTVRQLFFNVPVRRKFMRSRAYDAGEIQRTACELALANPRVRMTLISDEKPLFSVGGTVEEDFLMALKARATELFGRAFAAPLAHSDEVCGPIAVRGLFAPPHITRPSRAGQHLFLNGRAVGSSFIAEAIREAYGTRLGEGRHPIFIVHLDLPGDYVDVNVHPQKKTVRLRHEGALRDALHRAVHQSLSPQVVYQASCPKVERVCFDRSPSISSEPAAPIEEVSEVAPCTDDEQLVEVPLTLIGLFGRFLLIDGESLPSGLLEVQRALVLVDSQRALARLFFERMRSKEEESYSQMLLVPISLQLLPREAQVIEEHGEALTALGFGLRSLGVNSFIVDALPEELGACDVEKLVHELAAALQEPGRSALQSERRVAMAACGAASRRQRVGSSSEAIHLLRRLLACSDPLRCPLGTAIFAALSEEQILKLFH